MAKGVMGVSTNFAKVSPRRKESGSQFKQGKLSNANGAKGNGGAAGSGKVKPAPAKFGSETPARKNPFGSGAKQVKQSGSGGSKPFSGSVRFRG